MAWRCRECVPPWQGPQPSRSPWARRIACCSRLGRSGLNMTLISTPLFASAVSVLYSATPRNEQAGSFSLDFPGLVPPFFPSWQRRPNPSPLFVPSAGARSSAPLNWSARCFAVPIAARRPNCCSRPLSRPLRFRRKRWCGRQLPSRSSSSAWPPSCSPSSSIRPKRRGRKAARLCGNERAAPLSATDPLPPRARCYGRPTTRKNAVRPLGATVRLVFVVGSPTFSQTALDRFVFDCTW